MRDEHAEVYGDSIFIAARTSEFGPTARDSQSSPMEPMFATDDFELVGAVVPGWQYVTDTERERTREGTDWPVRSKSWEAAQGF